MHGYESQYNCPLREQKKQRDRKQNKVVGKNTKPCTSYRHIVNNQANSQLSTCSTFFLKLIAMNRRMMIFSYENKIK